MFDRLERFPSPTSTSHPHTQSPPITFHHFPSLSITSHHFPSLSITFHHFPSLSITFHHFPSLSITFHQLHMSHIVSLSHHESYLRSPRVTSASPASHESLGTVPGARTRQDETVLPKLHERSVLQFTASIYQLF